MERKVFEDAVKMAISWLEKNAGNYWFDDFDVDCPEELLEDFKEAMEQEKLNYFRP